MVRLLLPRSRRGHSAGIVGTALVLVLAAFLQSQEPATEEKPPQKKRIELDLTADPEDLKDLEKSLRWKKLFRLFAVADGHVFPARESGPNSGPPLRIWGHGWGTSLWRDPVTGWPLQ